MIKTLLANIQKIAREAAERNRTAFDERLDAFNDDFAKELEWGPATRGGVGFRTRTMVTPGNQTIQFRPSLASFSISTGSVAIGFWLIARFVMPGISAQHYFYDPFGVIRALYYQLQHQISIGKISVTLFGLVFVVIGLISLYKLFRPVKFDGFKKTFSKGYPFFHRTLVAFDEIKAIQILSENCKDTKNNSFISYELNLVLKNKSRITVIDHSDVSEIRRNGNELSKMMFVPVWDITRT